MISNIRAFFSRIATPKAFASGIALAAVASVLASPFGQTLLSDGNGTRIKFSDQGGSTPIGIETTGNSAIGTTVNPAYGLTVAGTLNATTLSQGGTAISSTYAPIASPNLTGTPTAPTPVDGDSLTKLANKGYVDAKVASACRCDE